MGLFVIAGKVIQSLSSSLKLIMHAVAKWVLFFIPLLYIPNFYSDLVIYIVLGDTFCSAHMACFLASISKSLFNVILVSTF